MPEVQELVALLKEWRQTSTTEARKRIWARMLEIRADQVFSIGTVNGSLQPVVRARRLQNVPVDALYGFEPTSYFGAYMPDTFFFEAEG
jgi:peptide/nickel transport system substrate-binding protein